VRGLEADPRNLAEEEDGPCGRARRVHGGARERDIELAVAVEVARHEILRDRVLRIAQHGAGVETQPALLMIQARGGVSATEGRCGDVDLAVAVEVAGRKAKESIVVARRVG
jgi:hypothetical protein